MTVAIIDHMTDLFRLRALARLPEIRDWTIRPMDNPKAVAGFPRIGAAGGTAGRAESWFCMHSTILKRSVVVTGHKTSISLEDQFWTALKELAVARNVSLSNLVATIDRARQRGNLSSAIRLFVLQSFRDRAERAGAGMQSAARTLDHPA
jgi:predicted DNA-binding ribbon-helix-helix protein